MDYSKIEKEFREKFGRFYVSIDSKTRAIRVVDIIDGVAVNGKDGSLIGCVASDDIETFLKQKLSEVYEQGRKDKAEEIKEIVKSMPTEYPLIESDDYDNGFKMAQLYILKKLN